ncbi:hypothetical protein LCGC14_0126410 [marine sediment metagenome]|uniref:Uncharacterized protein n=1 Tax=marine sediment metagenome TaxID=412755 RepID=A0A0F9V976_9ZZZZ
MTQGFKSRPRWLLERWLTSQKHALARRWTMLQTQLLPLDWQGRCLRISEIREGEVGTWQPRAGSSSAELVLLLNTVPFHQRRWLASLLDAATAGPNTLVEAVERLQLDWRSRLDPIRSRHEYAAQLILLARKLGLQPAAESAYIENEQKVYPAIDTLLFESLPMRLRTVMLSQHQPGLGDYLIWWQERLLARAGEAGFAIEQLGEHDWPDIPPAWLALGWLCGLRSVTGSGMPSPGRCTFLQ